MSVADWLEFQVVEIASVNTSTRRIFLLRLLWFPQVFSDQKGPRKIFNNPLQIFEIPGEGASKNTSSLSDDSPKTPGNMLRIAATVFLHSALLLLFCSDLSVECKKLAPPTKEQLKTEKLPPCAACRVLVESFKKGIDKTKRGKFEGGDSAWEEDKLKSYATSEVRLTEIQENLCNEVERGETQCHALAEELEHTIEDWWFKHQDAYPDIYIYVCVEQSKRCCPKDHFGPDCEKCAGFPDKVCNNNGKCKGSGTRKGNGQCQCDKGYTGEACGSCSFGHYESYRDENKMLCSSCHEACAGACKGAGPADCLEKCKEGWQMVGERGCLDINECLQSEKYCPGNQFCINKAGNYSCLGCDRACNGCSGDGPDMCIKCADGYEKKDNICINPDVLGRKKTENWARYFTYFGLCVATCIILYQRNLYAASAIGILVGVYISASEYMIATTDVQSAKPNMDILGPVE